MTQVNLKQELAVELLLHNFDKFLNLLKASVGGPSPQSNQFPEWLNRLDTSQRQALVEISQHFVQVGDDRAIQDFYQALQCASVDNLQPLQEALNGYAEVFIRVFEQHLDDLILLGQCFDKAPMIRSMATLPFYSHQLANSAKPLTKDMGSKLSKNRHP